MEFNAEKFIKDYKRMCDYYKNCDDCPLSYIQEDCRNIDNLTDVMHETSNWVEKHPMKTYLMDIKEKFPNLIVDDDFFDSCCVEGFYGGMGLKCKKECRDCWNREME